MEKIKNSSDYLKYFDQMSIIFRSFGSMTKNCSEIISALEGFVEQLKITLKVSKKIREEIGDADDKQIFREAKKRLKGNLALFQKELKRMNDPSFHLLLFTLPDKKGRKFFELMGKLDEIAKIPKTDNSKREKIEMTIKEIESYISELKEISKPFVPNPVNKNQTIIFKVMFRNRKGNWRKIELKAEQTLEDLHDAIQDILGWDDDHLYSFFMDNKFYSRDFKMEYTRPSHPEGRKTADVKIGIFDLKQGQKFAYVFDFGDEHRFEIEAVDFGTVQKSRKYPVLIESKGKAPEQYQDYD